MKFIIVFALFVGAFGSPNYGSSLSLGRSSFESAPLLRSSSYGSSFESAPLVRSSSYGSSFESAPIVRSSSYESAPIVRSSSYESAPIVRSSSYESAPIVESFEAPALKLESYGGEVRSFEQIPILRQTLNDDSYGTYDLQVETGNGIHSSESGTLRDLGGPYSEGPVNVKSGSYSYTSPEGIPIHTSWTADENGFRASGAHLPQPPAEFVRAHAAAAGYGSSSFSAPAVRVSSYSQPSLLLKSSGY